MSNDAKMNWLIEYAWRQIDAGNVTLEQKARAIYLKRLAAARVLMCGA
jgi:hypothetical protein